MVCLHNRDINNCHWTIMHLHDCPMTIVSISLHHATARGIKETKFLYIQLLCIIIIQVVAKFHMLHVRAIVAAYIIAMTLYVCMHNVYWPSKIGFCKLCFYFCVKCCAPIHASIISQMLMLAYYAQNSDASIICKALLASYTQKLQCLPSLSGTDTPSVDTNPTCRPCHSMFPSIFCLFSKILFTMAH